MKPSSKGQGGPSYLYDGQSFVAGYQSRHKYTGDGQYVYIVSKLILNFNTITLTTVKPVTKCHPTERWYNIFMHSCPLLNT